MRQVRRKAGLREMTTESRESGRNIIRLTGPKAKIFAQPAAAAQAQKLT